MLAKLRRHRPSHALVVAYLGLFVALGGSSYAALSLTGKDVKDGTLTGRDLKDNSVTGRDVRGLGSSDVADHSLLAKDFKAGQLPAGAQGDRGLAGPKGDPGAKGDPGPTAAAGSDDDEDTPAGPTHVLKQVQITMPAAGRIYVQATVRNASASCTFTSSAPGAAGNCILTVGLYVDGQPVPFAARSFGSSSASGGSSFSVNINKPTGDWPLFGVSGPITAGAHTIQLSGKLAATPTNGITTGSQGPNAPQANAKVGGIAVGV